MNAISTNTNGIETTPSDPVGCDKKNSLRRRYGISLDEYYRLLKLQNGHCALCPRTPEQERYGYLNVDHDHDTNEIRGLLCTPCNQAVGVLGDNKEGLARALAYVTNG